MVVKTFCENAHAYIKAKSDGNSPVELALKMEYFVQELMNDNGTILYFIKRNVDLSIILLNCIKKRNVPRVSNFAETIVPEFSSTDFRMHCRIDRATFEIILQTIAPHLTSNNVSGKEQTLPEKTIVIVNMVHFKPGVHARSNQFIWHFDLDCSWDSIEGLPCIQPDI
jgi:hypothetical protein